MATATVDQIPLVEHLEALGLYSMANDVRGGRAELADALDHVRGYCLAQVLGWIEDTKAREAIEPPVPGTVGASMLAKQEGRRDELQGFLERWDSTVKGGPR